MYNNVTMIIVQDFFFPRMNQEFSNQTVTQPLALKYMMYGLTGGFHHSKYFNRWIKISWTVITLLLYLSAVIMGCGRFWLITNNAPNTEITQIFVMAIINTFAFVIIPIFTYWHRRELETILDFVDKEWKYKGMSRKVQSCIDSRPKCILYFLATSSLNTFAFLLLYPLDLLISSPSKVDIINILDFFFPMPWLHQINSSSLFLFIFMIHSVRLIVSLIVLISWNPFFLSLAYQIYDAFLITCDRMHQFSSRAEEAFEKTYGKFSSCKDTFVCGDKGLQLAMEKKRIALQNQIESNRYRLFQNILITAREHQQLRR